MADVKITNLVEQETIDKIKELGTEIKGLLTDYNTTARELARGIEVPVKAIGDLERLEALLNTQNQAAIKTTEQLNVALQKQGEIIAQTTPVIARQLMEQERVNKSQREAYTEHDKVKRLLEHFHDTYENQVASYVKINKQLQQNKEEQKALEKQLSTGRVSMVQYTQRMADLVTQQRALSQEKKTLTSLMTAEEKAGQEVEDSYVAMSQKLELLKKAYKGLSEGGRSSEYGKELETTIQNLDAHLKDMAADMGEFQRNVGNYAIAGQQGVVSTESVIEAMNKEAVTARDLLDQIKILEEAKLMLNQNDANYQATLDALNEKIEENKRKLSDVSEILNKDATSVAEAEAQNKKLLEALKHVDLTSDDAQKRIKELNDKIAANTELIKRNTPEIDKQTKSLEKQNKTNEGLASNLLNMIGLNTRFGSSLKGLEGAGTGNVLEGLNIKVKAFGKTLMGLLSNPWVLSFLGIAGVVAGFKWWYDYNKGLIEASRLTQNFTGLSGDAADKLTTDLQAVADHMGKSFNDTIGAANVLVQHFGISWEEALEKIEDGIQAGANMNGKFVDNIKQFTPALRDAGVSVDEFVAILAETRNGIFDERGVQDIIKGGTRLRAMTKQVAESLDACGISSKQMQQDLEDGNITMLEAVQQVAAKLKELPENSQEAGKVIKDVFGRTAAEGGTLLIQSLADVNTNLDEAKERMGNLGKVNREQMEAQKELNETLAAVFKMSGTSFEEMTTSAKTYIVQGLTNIIKGCVDIVNWFIRMYNKSLVVRGGVNAIVNAFKIMWEISKFVINNVVDSFKALGTVIEGVVTLNWDKVMQGWKEGMNALKGNVETIARNIASNMANAFNNTLNDEMKEVSVDLNANLNGIGANTPGNTPKTKPNGNESENETDTNTRDKAAREAEKRAKEELKRINELEESKISLMAEGHEKDLAMIRLKYKKKIDEIRKNGETENALRIQLAAEYENEIAECEKKYQTQLSRINLENKLASVKEGSQEELTLKLAMLEANRTAEIEAAQKTGADVNLINDKFNKERLDLEEEYAAKSAALIEQEYANKQETRDNAYVAESNALKAKYAKELEAAKGNAEKQAEITAKYEDEQAQLSERYAQETAENSIKLFEDILKNEKLSADDRLKYEQALAKAKSDLESATADAAIANIKRVTDADQSATDKRIASAQMWMQKAAEAMNAINDLASTIYDGKIQRLEDEQDANDEAAEAEKERISQLVENNVITEEEGEARKRAAEAATAKKNEELEKKKAALKHKQAVWDKANSIAQCGISTALAIMNALQMQPFPVGIAMAAIAGAMGAIQLATILATPIPKYAKGTDRHKGGPAIVGDGGQQEVVLYGGAAYLTPDTPTLVNIPAGASVLPSVAGIDEGLTKMVALSNVPQGDRPVIVNNDYTELKREITTLVALTRAQIKQQRILASNKDFNAYRASI